MKKRNLTGLVKVREHEIEAELDGLDAKALQIEDLIEDFDNEKNGWVKMLKNPFKPTYDLELLVDKALKFRNDIEQLARNRNLYAEDYEALHDLLEIKETKKGAQLLIMPEAAEEFMRRLEELKKSMNRNFSFYEKLKQDFENLKKLFSVLKPN